MKHVKHAKIESVMSKDQAPTLSELEAAVRHAHTHLKTCEANEGEAAAARLRAAKALDVAQKAFDARVGEIRAAATHFDSLWDKA
jgi:hypothetical protein